MWSETRKPVGPPLIIIIIILSPYLLAPLAGHYCYSPPYPCTSNAARLTPLAPAVSRKQACHVVAKASTHPLACLTLHRHPPSRHDRIPLCKQLEDA